MVKLIRWNSSERLVCMVFQIYCYTKYQNNTLFCADDSHFIKHYSKFLLCILQVPWHQLQSQYFLQIQLKNSTTNFWKVWVWYLKIIPMLCYEHVFLVEYSLCIFLFTEHLTHEWLQHVTAVATFLVPCRNCNIMLTLDLGKAAVRRDLLSPSLLRSIQTFPHS